MATTANIALIQNQFVATMSDGRRLQNEDLREFAHDLAVSGIGPNGVTFEWRAGQRMITAGQQSAIFAELRRWEPPRRKLTVAA